MNRLLKFLLFITSVIILICLFDFQLYENMTNVCEDLSSCEKTKIQTCISHLKTKLYNKLPKNIQNKLDSLNDTNFSEKELIELIKENKDNIKAMIPDSTDLKYATEIAQCLYKNNSMNV